MAIYIEQYKRMLRYYERFEGINEGRSHSKASEFYDDDVYAFFQNCYHLKDWIKSDPDCNSWSCVEQFINENREMRICADLCNVLKHCSLIRSRSGDSPNFSGSHIDLEISESASEPTSVKIAIKYKVSSSGGELEDAFEIATQCLTLWDAYIEKQA
ncbi:hypothetical protein OH456_12460 [Vibrio sp. La 4.2.2]|uniref:hypothetical protein n=1 Tax=Vibrio sp. La 4.2.2 TaxID=2998830 RepID=UPI0022CE08F5|nr:hypothetical protein [Vibrio sp. La 4.2.2]MDA0108973.1 hypothetical protein [Vibrio sp. La 4.2.2]